MYKDKEITACFTGHRPSDLPFKESETDVKFQKYKTLLELTIARLYAKFDVRVFMTGMALGIDLIAAETVLKMKKRYKDIRLVAVLPCREQTDLWNENDRIRHDAVMRQADNSFMVCEEYSEDCMIERNRYLVENSAYCVATWTGSVGGTSMTVNMAKKECLRLFIIDPRVPCEIPFENSYAYPNDAPEDLFTPEIQEETENKEKLREPEPLRVGNLKGKRY